MTDSQRRPPEPMPLSVLTGFLGAGKTTLLNALLKAPELSDTLVLINEFGEIGLDHLLVENVSGDMLLLSSGCLCCTVRGDLVATLEDMLRRLDNGRVKHFRRVIVETTGLADPAPVLHTIMAHPYLRLRFRLDGVVTLVDAVNGAATLDAHAEAVKQAAVADRLVLTKTDLVEAHAQIPALRARLAALNPSAAILDAAEGEASAAKLLDAGLYDPGTKIPQVRQWLRAEAHEHHHDHHHHAPHDVNRHDDRIRAFCLREARPVTGAAFDMFLELLRSSHGPKLLRVKGIVATADDPARPVVIHGVQHIFHPPLRLAAWPDADHDTRVVFIVRDLNPSFVEGLWRAFTGGVAVDQPDLAGLRDNPLRIERSGLLA